MKFKAHTRFVATRAQFNRVFQDENECFLDESPFMSKQFFENYFFSPYLTFKMINYVQIIDKRFIFQR